MAKFSVRNVSSSTVPAPVTAIWGVLTDPTRLAEATPILRAIEVVDPFWVWRLHAIEAFGVKLEAEFTERMRFTELEAISFEHAPPAGAHERVGIDGIYELTRTDDDVTDLMIDLTLSVDAPLPRLAARPVEAAVRATMRSTGQRFAVNLYEQLDLDPATVSVTEHEVA